MPKAEPRIALAPDLEISRVVVGLWQVADMERSGRTLDPEAASSAMLDYARAGFDSFDMADHYGTAELIAGRLSPEEICTSIGADSLGYVSLAGLTEATTLPESRLCRACFDGKYPVPVPDDDRGKHVLDGLGVGS